MWPLASWRCVQVGASPGDTMAPWQEHHLGPGPDDWSFRIHGAHEGCRTLRPQRCLLDALLWIQEAATGGHVFLPPPSSICTHALTHVHTLTLTPILGNQQPCPFCPQAQVLA